MTSKKSIGILRMTDTESTADGPSGYNDNASTSYMHYAIGWEIMNRGFNLDSLALDNLDIR